MSYSFVAASSQYLFVNEAPLAAPPLMITAWVKIANIDATTKSIMLIGDKDVADQYLGAVSRNDDVLAQYRTPTALSETPLSGSEIAANVWTPIAARFDSETTKSVYVQGNQGTAAIESVGTVTGIDRIIIGAQPSPTNFFSGLIAHACLWNTTGLNEAGYDNLASALASGVSPLNVSTTATLVRFYPLTADLTEQSGNAGAALTAVGATFDSENPPLGGSHRYITLLGVG